LPRRDNEDQEDYYHASMLAFLKPWRSLQHLKSAQESWENAFTAFIANSPRRVRNVIAAAQYYYDSKSAADQNRDSQDVISCHPDVARRQNCLDDDGDVIMNDVDES